jgi:two-component system, NarL family, response regulator
MSPLKLLLVEDDELFRLGLQFRLQQEANIEIIAQAADGETAVELANRHPLDLVLLDVGLPRMSGLEACRQIRAAQPQLPILALTSHAEQSLITRLIEAGVQGYCLKGIAAELLILAVRSVAAGASWWDRTATAEIRATMPKFLPPPFP